MDSYGIDINPHIPRIPEAEDYLRYTFQEQFAHYLSVALSDNTKRRNLPISMDYPTLHGYVLLAHSPTVNYNRKERRFTFITYTVGKYGKRFWI